MNKKGFTLIELLTVIVILGILSMIAVPTVLNAIETSKEKTCHQQRIAIIDAAKRWGTDNFKELPTENEVKEISLEELKTKGYLKTDKELKDPQTNETLTGSVTITYQKDTNQYEYNYNLSCNSSAAETIKKEVVTEGDGLYKGETKDDEYIFKGADPGNYIKLGDDLYRIVSIESDGTLKVMKIGSVGSKAYDEAKERYSTDKADYCTFGYGCKVWGSNTTMLNSSGQRITQMPQSVGGKLYNLPDKEATLNIYLNTEWYNNLKQEVKDVIVPHLFNVGMVDINETDINTTIKQEEAYKWYGKVGITNISDYVKASTNPVCKNVKDYSSNSDCYSNSQNHNWVFEAKGGDKNQGWSMNPYSNETGRDVIHMLSNGQLGGNNSSHGTHGITPVLFLKSDLKLEGSGTKVDPYIIKQD